MQHSFVVYHTVENRGDASTVLRDAPFKCTRLDAWLGSGYYFWESSAFAHKWGCDSYGGQYHIIKYQLELFNLFDLVGSQEHRELMMEYYQILVDEAEVGTEPTIREILTYLKASNKRRPGLFHYDSVRAQDHCSESQFVQFRRSGPRETMDLNPRVQICLFVYDLKHFPSECAILATVSN